MSLLIFLMCHHVSQHHHIIDGDISWEFGANRSMRRHLTSHDVIFWFLLKICWKSADVSKILTRNRFQTSFSVTCYLLATKWGVNHFSTTIGSNTTAISVGNLKIADVSKIMTSEGKYWYFCYYFTIVQSYTLFRQFLRILGNPNRLTHIKSPNHSMVKFGDDPLHHFDFWYTLFFYKQHFYKQH